MPADAGKMLLFAGLVAVAVGLYLMNTDKTATGNIFNWFGNMPLDIKMERENFRFYFPMGSSIVFSLLLSLILYLLNKFIR